MSAPSSSVTNRSSSTLSSRRHGLRAGVVMDVYVGFESGDVDLMMRQRRLAQQQAQVG